MTLYLDRLSDFAAGLTYETLTDSARTATRDVVMDTLGAILRGSRLLENTNLAHLVSETSMGGTATVLGHSLKAQPMMATLVNATAGVCLEMDEGTRLGGGHPAIHVVPGALAMAEEMGVGGQRLMESVVVGYEVSSRIGGATRTKFNVHSHGTWGTIGTAVAVAKLMNFNPPQMRQVINLAASMSPANSWTPCFEGATIRNLYPGRSGMQGILAVHLQNCGYTALDDSPSDLYSTILGDSFDPEATIVGLGADTLRIEQNYFKFHACCLYNHPTLDAVKNLMSKEDFSHRDVDWVKITTVPFGDRMANEYPENMLSAKFHIPFAVAACLVKGRTDILAFMPETVADPTIKEVARRVRVVTDPDMDIQQPRHVCARVDVGLKNGRTMSESSKFVHGDFQNRRSRQELKDKFMSLSGEVLGEVKARETLGLLDCLDELTNVKELTSQLGPI